MSVENWTLTVQQLLDDGDVTGLSDALAASLADSDGWSAGTTKDIPASLLDCSSALVDWLLAADALSVGTFDDVCCEFLQFEDVQRVVWMRLEERLNKPEQPTEAMAANIFRLLCATAAPTDADRCFKLSYADPPARRLSRKALRRRYSDVWLAFCKQRLGDSLLRRVLLHVSDEVLERVVEASFFVDFFVRAFEMGDPWNVCALGGLFTLVLKHNLEYPDFYQRVYVMVQPAVCYGLYAQRFLKLIDTLLSSTHLPLYLVAAFAKRLSRVSLLAPLPLLVPLLTVVRNLLVRHPQIDFLVDRQSPNEVDGDPYDFDQADPFKCGAQQSALWELRTHQQHWYSGVKESVAFLHAGADRLEAFIKWTSFDKIIDAELNQELDDESEKVPLTFLPPTGLFVSKLMPSLSL